MSSLNSSSKIDMINTINSISMQSTDGFTIYQLGYAKGYVAGINSAAGNPITSARESYDALTRSMDSNSLDTDNQQFL